MRIIIALLLFELSQGVIFGQVEPLSFFPHHKGDIWEYYESTGDLSKNTIFADSLGSDGSYYLETTMFGKMRIDTAAYEVYSNRWGGKEYSNLIYKLSADSGDTWVVYRNEVGAILAQVKDTYPSFVFGSVSVIIMEIEEFDSASGLLFYTDYLATDFGLIGQDNDTFPVRSIKGTLIGGVKHGTITSIEQEYFGLPNTFSLLQNYPNPFNSTTIVSFDLSRQSKVTIKVFDILGRERSVLVDGIRTPGRQIIPLTADGWPSGVYFLQMITDGKQFNKRMTILK